MAKKNQFSNPSSYSGADSYIPKSAADADRLTTSRFTPGKKEEDSSAVSALVGMSQGPRQLLHRMGAYYDSHPHISGPMLVILLSMLAFGMIMLFSASMIGSLYNEGKTSYFIIRQIAFTLFAFIPVWFITHINIRRFDRKIWVMIAMGISILLLVLVLIPGIGINLKGARRWLPIPFTTMTFQPSEFTKIVTVFYLGWYYSRLRKLRLKGLIVAEDPKKQIWLDAWVDIIKPMIPVVIQLVLISLQAHMSATVIIFVVSAFLILSAGVNWRSWLIGSGVALALLTVLLSMVMFISAVAPEAQFTQRWNHVAKRINIFAQDETITESDRWQSEQALLAVGSGGVTGLGLGQSRQKYRYLPENHNDYLYSIICEETGFLGGTFVIFLFAAYLIQGIIIARKTKTVYGRILACGYTYLITLQAYLCIGVNLSVLPPTGISMPFFSYGGTSNLFFLMGAGLLLSVSKFDNKEFVSAADERQEVLAAIDAKWKAEVKEGYHG